VVRQQAISLRGLMSQLDSREAFNLFGSTWVRGFVFTEDEGGKDCILLTDVEPDRPPLRLDDFAVAYQNVKHGFVRPGCSIDPREETTAELVALLNGTRKRADPVTALLGRLIFDYADPDEAESADPVRAATAQRAEFERIARSPQDVRVFGVSPDTHFAFVMVDADYHMKSVVNGDEKFPGITGTRDLRIEQRRRDAYERRASKSSMFSDRYWFNPGKPLYRRDDSAFILDACPVVLRTEAQSVTPEGGRMGLSRPDPLAQKFADQFTAKYQTMAKLKPRYRELENLYRFVALAQLLQGEGREFGFNDQLDRLFRRVEIERYDNPTTLPGKPSTHKYSGRTRDGRHYYRGILRSCGGVSMNFAIVPAENRLVEPQGQADVNTARQTVVQSRPSPKAVRWEFDSEAMRKLGR
jgi:hypothetical protein